MMQRHSLLVLDCDPRFHLSLRSVLESLGTAASISYHACAASAFDPTDRSITKLLTQLNPSVIFLVLAPELIKQPHAVFRVLKPTSATVIVVAEKYEPDEVFALLKLGAADYITPPLNASNILPRVRRLLERPVAHKPAPAPDDEPPLQALIGKSPVFNSEIEKIPPIAASDAGVLITGETGTGKELCARAIHQLSPRAHGPYVPVNCGAIPVELAENELFGHKRGAFTDAGSSQAGLIEAAAGGTLFLDEINSLPLQIQSKLLRFLQEKEYRPLGSTEVIKSDVRIIAAASDDIGAAVREGRLRSDLYYRLNVLQLRLPPLRERREDISLLARHFLARQNAGAAQAKDFSPEALESLEQYDWPGNVRELEHTIARAFVLCKRATITAADIMHPKGASRSFRAAKLQVIEEFERTYLKELLAAHQGNVSHAAAAARKERSNFRRLLQKYGLRPMPALDRGNSLATGAEDYFRSSPIQIRNPERRVVGIRAGSKE